MHSKDATNSHFAPLIAELSVIHKYLIEKHLVELSAADRRLRFGVSAGDASIGLYVNKIDFDQDIALGAFDQGGELVGFGHLVLHAELPELGVSVASGARGTGVAGLLLARACGLVRRAGRTQLTMHYLPENVALARLAQRAGMRLDVIEGERRGILTLPAAPESSTSDTARVVADAVELAFRLASQDSAAATSA